MTVAYDNLIKSAAADYLPGTDWRLIKAQLMQESRLDPFAISKAGARGIAQFMPDTWDEITEKMRLQGADIESPAYAIPACAYYMSELYKQWTAPRPPADRYCLALASYNAGLKNILKAQAKAGGVNDYRAIIAALHHVTGERNARETRDYVRRIYGYWLGYIIG